MHNRTWRIAALLLALLVITAGCSQKLDDTETGQTDETQSISRGTALGGGVPRRSVDQMPDITNGHDEIIPEYERRDPVVPEADGATPDADSGAPPTASQADNPPPAKDAVPDTPPGDMSLEEEVVAITNGLRLQAGLEPLAMDSALSDLARLKSEDMATGGYFSHDSPTYGSTADLLSYGSISYRAFGENIAYGQRDADTVVADWFASPGHRSNMLGENFSKIGVGVAEAPDGSTYWTQLFTG